MARHAAPAPPSAPIAPGSASDDGRAPPRGGLVERAWVKLRSIPPSLVIGLGALSLIDVWWMERFRAGYPLGIDESGYLAMGYADSTGLKDGGLNGLWNAVQSSKLQAPLTPLLTVPLHVLFGSSLADGFALSLVFAVLLGVLTYVIARPVMSRRWSVLGALTLAASPGIFQNEHNFAFALPLAVMLTASVWALGRAEGMVRSGWALVAGVFIALACLSRTMGLALVAGPVLAAAAQAALLGPVRRRLVNFGVMLAAAVAVASIWYVHSLSTVIPYLEGKGPSFRTANGHKTPNEYKYPIQALGDLQLHDLYLALALGLLGCFVIGVVVAIDKRRARRAGGSSPTAPWMDRIRAWVGARGFVTVMTLVVGTTVLCTAHQSTNEWVPLLPVLTVCALACVARARWDNVRWAVGGYLVLMIVFNTMMMSDTVSWLSERTVFRVPGLGVVPITDGTSDIRGQVYLAGEPQGTTTAPMPAQDKQWLPLSRKVAGWVISFAHGHDVEPVVAFSSTDRLFNTNSVQLEGEIGDGQSLAMAQLLPTIGGDTVGAYRAFLVNPKDGVPNFLISVDPHKGEYRPVVNQAKAQAAARSLGFTIVHRFRLPDGRQGRIWWRPPVK